MLNWQQNAIERSFWGGWGRQDIHFWQMHHNQSWKNDFLSTTTNESPMVFSVTIAAPPPTTSVRDIIQEGIITFLR